MRDYQFSEARTLIREMALASCLELTEKGLAATGIGLYLVARLCSKMGIDVTAASEPGKGFVVTFAFSTNKFQYFE